MARAVLTGIQPLLAVSSVKMEVHFILCGKMQHPSHPGEVEGEGCSILRPPDASECLPKCSSDVRMFGVDGWVLRQRWGIRVWEEKWAVLSPRAPLQLVMNFSKDTFLFS